MGDDPDVSNHGSLYERRPTPHRRSCSTVVAMCATERNPIELPHEDDNDAALGRQVEQVTPCRAAL